MGGVNGFKRRGGARGRSHTPVLEGKGHLLRLRTSS